MPHLTKALFEFVFFDTILHKVEKPAFDPITLNFSENSNYIFKSLLTTTSNASECFAFTPQAKFPDNDLNFTEGEGDEIEFRLSS